MNAQMEMIEEPNRPLSMHPQKFAMWLFIVSIVMIFAALSSAYIVRQADGNWLVFELPKILWVNSGAIILSSICMQWAYLSAKKDNLEQVKLATTFATLLGVGFLVGQVYAWGDMVDNQVYLVGNPSGSFVYILTGLHGLHLISGIIFLLIVLVSTFKYQVHSKNMARIEMCTTYWHFLGGLWLYLFIFLLLYR